MSSYRHILLPLLALTSGSPHRRQTSKVGYLFVHFYDNYKSPGDYSTYPAGEQIFAHISDGNDATAYKPLNGGAPLLTSNVGTRAVRDMYLVSKPDESQHYIIATDLNQTAVGGFGGKFLSRSLVIWDSQGASLSKWNAPRLVEVVPEEFRMAWAPEAVWDAAKSQFLVYWSSNRYADAQHTGEPDYDKIYTSYTSDFKTFTSPELYLDRGNNIGVIDMTIHSTNNPSNANEYVRFFKEENVYKCRGQVSTSGVQGPWEDIGASNQYVDNDNQSEACLFFQDNIDVNKWWIFLDQYGRNPAGYYPYTADNGITKYGYTDRGVTGAFPPLLKHGVVKPLTQAQYDDVSQWKS
ncbi:hypothetical protein IE81DRAFT_338323 [Ceraceosorus guamensis]|uniref:Uncharacterized protein n=1 Tax=Ceraceosorus guamensis TaxID=1522189 RepID=A0A316VU69_9BASI|nr:hypothetical protein IE81DRAFT_338323 [Ceraceosorus guamensis]PWN39801.1 hypothetical protein IE81DRAFT_338323 [Ceraceosorus guamensis]